MSNIEIGELSLGEAPKLTSLFHNNEFHPYRFVFSESKKELVRFLEYEITSLINEKTSTVYFLSRNNQIIGIAAYTKLPWDSAVIGHSMSAIQHFYMRPGIQDGLVVAKMLVDRVVDHARNEGAECLVSKPYSNDFNLIHALESHGFLLVDTLLDYVYDIRRYPLETLSQIDLDNRVKIRSAKSGDLDGLVEVAKACFQGHFGRYHSDQRIPKDRADQIYVEWIKSSLAGYADWIVVVEHENRIVGYSVWKKPSLQESEMSVRVGHYSIGAVHPDYSGRKFFTAITLEGLKLFDGVADVIKGPTHINNYPVQRGYAKLNWHIVDSRFSFHKWLV